MNEEDITTRIIIGDSKTSNYIIYTADGTEFHLKEFSDMGSGILEGGDSIKFHPENIIAIRKKKV